ncbi:MAG: SulP family inorganic anion transporter [Gammaproteobacteria bacterium]|nr:SulP family inorganic anion transporter [Gammaproteobacteria bacterium]
MTYSARDFAGDIYGGLTATVVSLPAALAFGIASGLGAAAGLYGSVGVGLFAVLFGGTKGQISGPTGPMAVVVAVIVTSHATSIGEALTIVAMGGCIQVFFGLIRIGRFIAYTPQAVISGFMSGIGLIIILIQLLPFVGLSAGGGPIDSVTKLFEEIPYANMSAFSIATISFLIVILWPRRASVYIPGPVVALVIGTTLGMVWLTDAPIIGEVPVGMPELTLSVPTLDFLVRALEPALILALLGSVDSLLTSLVAESVTGSQHKPNKELIGQGLGNICAGAIGGMAGAGNTLGTLTNIRAGGSTRVSGIVYTLLMLSVVLGLGKYVSPIPHAVLAAILIKIGIDIIDWRNLRYLLTIPRGFMLVMITTMGITVFIDLVTAVTVGLIIAGLAHASQLERLELDNVISVPLLDSTFLHPDDMNSDRFLARVGLVALRGTFTVASSHRLVNTFSADIKDHEIVIFDFTETVYMDDSSALVTEQLMGVAANEKTDVIIVGLSDSIRQLFDSLNVLKNVPDSHILDRIEDAREIAQELLDD